MDQGRTGELPAAKGGFKRWWRGMDPRNRKVLVICSVALAVTIAFLWIGERTGLVRNDYADQQYRELATIRNFAEGLGKEIERANLDLARQEEIVLAAPTDNEWTPRHRGLANDWRYSLQKLAKLHAELTHDYNVRMKEFGFRYADPDKVPHGERALPESLAPITVAAR